MNKCGSFLVRSKQNTRLDNSMGTELQCSPNFFTTLPRSHGTTVTISFDAKDTQASSTGRPPKKKTRSGSASDPPPQSMERLQCHKESLRKIMLEHEKVFKEQVLELHRLYKTQKVLMSQLRSRDPKLQPLAYATPGAGLWSSASSCAQASSSLSTSNRHHLSAQLNREHNSHAGHRTKASLSSQELAICTKENLCAPSEGFEHQPPGVSDATEAQDHKPSTETPPSCSDEECDLELTLSIGCGGSKKRAGRRSDSDTPSGCRPESSANSTGHRTSSTTPARSDSGGRADPAVGFDRESLPRPAWLFQGLSLNRT